MIKGKFKQVEKQCRATCKQIYSTHEEKETDVNIALYLLNEAYKNTFDKALIISGDSDLLPAVKLVKTLFPNKIISVVVPKNGNTMLNIGDKGTSCRLSENNLKNSLIENPYKLKDGTSLQAPIGWI